MSVESKLRDSIRTISDFPKPGIQFKDITPVLRDPDLCRDIVRELCLPFQGDGIEVIAGIESRGFLFGMMMAQELNCSFAVIRKKGKLPHRTVEHEYQLEYGMAVIEMHHDEIAQGQKVLIHDDLLATGGTAAAAAELISQVGGKVVGFSFVIELDFLNGRSAIKHHSQKVVTIVNY